MSELRVQLKFFTECQNKLESKLKFAKNADQENKLLRMELETERKKLREAHQDLDRARKDKIDAQHYITDAIAVNGVWLHM